MNIIGLEEKQTVFILSYSQIVKEEFFDDLNSLVNNGEIHGIYNKEEYEHITSQAKAKITSDELKGQINSSYILSEFFKKCKENLHLILEMSPTGANLRERIRKYKSIVNCSNILWIEEWPNSGFKAVAEHHFRDFQLTGSKDAMIDIMITFNNDAALLARTPNIFEDFLSNFCVLFNEIKTKLTEIQEKYERGLERLTKAKEAVEEFQTYLDTKTPELKEKKKDIAQILEVYGDEMNFWEKKRDFVKQQEVELLSKCLRS
jgi:dynein heavy chain